MLTINELLVFHTDVRGVSLVFLNLIYVSQVDDLLTVNELLAFHTDVRGVSLVSLIPFSDCASQPIYLFAVSMSQPCGDLSKMHYALSCASQSGLPYRLPIYREAACIRRDITSAYQLWHNR